MTDRQPVKVPPELFTEWLSDALLQHDAKSGTVAAMVADRAAQWGADAELEACVEWLIGDGWSGSAAKLRAARRSKSPSLKQQALEELELLRGDANCMGMGFDAPAIRRALEAIPDD